MKRIVSLTAALFVLAAANAFASYDCDSKTLGSSSTVTVKLSKNVCMEYEAGGSGTGYIAGTSHNKGTKTYGSSSGDAKVYEKAGTNNGLPDAPAGTASADWNGWTSL